MGELLGITYREDSRKPMLEIDACTVSEQTGVNGDYRGQPNKRQVTVLCEEKWRAACADLGEELHWTTRRANLLVRGVAIGPECIGKILKVGDMTLKVVMETDPCFRMDELRPGLKAALTPDWRGGACCTVLSTGDIAVGDGVAFLEE